MSWSHQIETTAGKLKAELKKLDEPERKAERDQLVVAAEAALALLPHVSKRDHVLVTLTGHDDPNAEGFNGRYVGVTVSRVDPEAFKQRKAEAKAEAERVAQLEAAKREAEEAEAQAEENSPPTVLVPEAEPGNAP